MARDESYTPFRSSPVSPAPPKPTEALWEVSRDCVLWSCALVNHGEWGWEARILKNGEFRMSHRFPLKAGAMQWAEDERQSLTHGDPDDLWLPR